MASLPITCILLGSWNMQDLWKPLLLNDAFNPTREAAFATMRPYTMFNGAKSMQMLTQQRKRVDPSAKPRDVWWANNDYELANLTWFGLKLCPVCFLYIHGIAASTTARTWVQAALRGEDGSRKAASRRPSQKRSNTMKCLDDILATMTEIGPTDGFKKVLGATKDEYLKTMEIFFRTLSLQVGYKVGGLKRSSFYSLWHDKYSDFIVSSSSLHGKGKERRSRS
eukprot:g28263.t1